MIAVDTSALMAIVLLEKQAAACSAALETDEHVVISAGTVAEALVVAAGRSVSAQMQQLIEIHDGAVVSWPTGASKPKTSQLSKSVATGASALGGAFWGMLFGLLFFIPIFGLAVGAAIGALPVEIKARHGEQCLGSPVGIRGWATRVPRSSTRWSRQSKRSLTRPDG